MMTKRARYSTCVFTGFFRLFALSRVHVRCTSPHTRCLLRWSINRSWVSSGHVEHCQLSTMPHRHRSSLSTLLGRFPGGTRRYAYLGRYSMRDGQSKVVGFQVSHSSDLLYALPITARGLYVLPTRSSASQPVCSWDWPCKAHPCPRGSTVTSRGTHRLFCKRSTGRSNRHHQINHAV